VGHKGPGDLLAGTEIASGGMSGDTILAIILVCTYALVVSTWQALRG
jgi:hypothetical protein